MNFDLNGLVEGLSRFDEKADKVVKMFAETAAATLEADAKQNRPWTDRSGDARKRLRGYVESIPNGYKIILAHGVDYGLWLEVANDGMYGIVKKTVRMEAPYIMRDFSGLMEKIK